MFETPLQYFTAAAYTLYSLTMYDFAKQLYTKQRSNKYWAREDLTLEDVQKRYDEAGKKLPKISIMIPARNESDVIRDTVIGLSKLNYPRDRLELLVVTDEKEDLEDLDRYLSSDPLGQDKTFEKTQTTLEITRKVSKELEGELNVKSLSVPVDFDGYCGGRGVEKAVRSTKGRALNYGLNFVSENADVLGIFDADAKPDPDVLLGVANKLLEEPDTALMQGPIFQVRNHHDIGPFGKFISLFQAMTHEWIYPKILEKFPFIGGTNYFVKPDLVKEVDGFDPWALSEDFDLGARLWGKKDIQAKFIPYPALEQTPPTYRSYFRQRFRWRAGGFDVRSKIMHSDYPKEKKKWFRNWFLKNELTIVRGELNTLAAPVPAIVLYALGNSPAIGPLFWIFTGLNLPLLAFPAYLRHRYSKYMDSNGKNSTSNGIGQDLKLTISSIPFSLGAPQPFFYAGLRHFLGLKSDVWHKTPRTKSNGTESQKDDMITVSTLDDLLFEKGMNEEYALKQLRINFQNTQKEKFYDVKKPEELGGMNKLVGLEPTTGKTTLEEIKYGFMERELEKLGIVIADTPSGFSKYPSIFGLHFIRNLPIDAIAQHYEGSEKGCPTLSLGRRTIARGPDRETSEPVVSYVVPGHDYKVGEKLKKLPEGSVPVRHFFDKK